MTSAGERNNKNLTLRLPEDIHRQLATQAERAGLALSAHLTNIIRRHLMETGYFPDVIKSLSGRLFEIGVNPIPRGEHPGSYFCSRFDVTEIDPLFTNRRAYYVFGVSSDLSYVQDPYGVVRDVGLAFLNFYNRRGLELDQLAWHQNHSSIPAPPAPELTDNWRYIGPETTRNIDEFLVTLARNQWNDELLVLTGQSQHVRKEGANKEDLHHAKHRPVLIARQADFERYAYSTAESWIRLNGYERLPKSYSDEGFNALPRYIQKQIDADEYHEIVLRCFAYLQSRRR